MACEQDRTGQLLDHKEGEGMVSHEVHWHRLRRGVPTARLQPTITDRGRLGPSSFTSMTALWITCCSASLLPELSSAAMSDRSAFPCSKASRTPMSLRTSFNSAEKLILNLGSRKSPTGTGAPGRCSSKNSGRQSILSVSRHSPVWDWSVRRRRRS